MRKTITYPFLILLLLLFCWINLPSNISNRMRLFTASFFTGRSCPAEKSEILRLELENQNLRAQVDRAYEWLTFEKRFSDQCEFLKELELRPFCQKRAAHLRNVLKHQLVSIAARVIYRDPSSWSSSLWVDVGEENNISLQRQIIAKNSPVLSEGALVGVVDYVGKKQARIRLITDSGLSPSVRVSRGALQNQEILQAMQTLLKQLEKREDLFSTGIEKQALLTQLKSLKEKMGLQLEDGYLAKGEVHGSSTPFWRSRSPILKGIGFNFDYPDEEGMSLSLKESAVSIIKEGDLLITSGLDGVFPSGLPVGTVSKVYPLKEGSYSYNIEVHPVVQNLNDLQTVMILSPVNE
jgi:rod shape-determining protein MreC